MPLSDLAEWILEDNLNVRRHLQIHKDYMAGQGEKACKLWRYQYLMARGIRRKSDILLTFPVLFKYPCRITKCENVILGGVHNLAL